MDRNEYAVEVSVTINIKADNKTEARETVNKLLNQLEYDCSWDIIGTQSYDEIMNE